MNKSSASSLESAPEEKIPTRDWILLPLLSVVTIIFLACSTELLGRWVLPASKTLAEDCMVSNDTATGMRGIPNAVCWDRVLDGEWTEYKFNSSGYRSDVDFGPKPEGTYRIAMVGTSFAAGLRVPVNETFAATLPAELSQRTGRKVELYNEGIVRRLPDVIAEHFNEVLKVKPDMILWIVTRSDVQSTAMIPKLQNNAKFEAENMFQRNWRLLKSEPFGTAVVDIFNYTHTSTMLRHYLYQSQYLYVKSYLMADDHEMGYLRAQPSAEWQKRLHQFDVDAAALTNEARKAGIPLVVVYLPRGQQAAMISMNDWPQDYDPFKLDDELRSIIERHGGIYLDILPDFRTIPHPERGFYRVEGHPNAQGHALISNLLAKELTGGAVPELRAADQPQTNLAQRR
jgi:hypothetical protein